MPELGGGGVLGMLYEKGFVNIYGFDASESGIILYRRIFPEISGKFYSHNAYENVLPKNLQFIYDAVLSIEVIEHLYDPRTYLKNVHSWLKTNGKLILNTPFHGYLKNNALSLLNKFDKHFNPLWDGGHIKFSLRTPFPSYY